MGIKLEGFLCDSCRIFTIFTGVKSSPDDLDDIAEGKSVLPNLSYVKTEGWEYYNYIQDPDDGFTSEWIKIGKGFKCYCPKCARILKLKKVISNIKSYD